MSRTGRPKRKIDFELVEKLAQIHCSIREIAAFINIPESTLKNREDFQTHYKKGLEVGKMSLRRIQFKMAERSAAMAIWLGKQYLGQQENNTIDDDWITEELEILDKTETQNILNNRMEFLN